MAHSSRACNHCSHERRSSFMKWLCAFLKGTKPGVPSCRWPRLTAGEESTLWQEPTRPKANPPRHDNEELDRAIAQSLAEDDKNPKEPNHKGDNNDEDLARAIQDSLNMNPYTPYNPYAPSQAQLRGHRVCGHCKHEIGHGHYLSCMGMYWHPQCFRCSSCGHAIRETEFTLLGADPYHKLCYKELHHPKCDVCLHFIPTNRDGLIEYRAHPFWGQKYCPLHEHDSTPRCCSCEKMEPRNTNYMSLGDGRSLCMECLGSAVMDTGECQPLYHSIRDYYEGMNMKLDQQIPMLLVERQALNEAMEGESKGPHHVPETRGLCLSEEQTVRNIYRRPRIGDNRLLGMRTQHQKLTRRCEVTAILVLYGLPRLLTGSILAHELMHGWLRLKRYRNLNAEVEEGICQVMSYLWLESEILPASSWHAQPSSSYASSSSSSRSYPPTSFKKGGISHTEKKLGEFFMHQIANDTSTAYGDGFRTAYAAVNKYGLSQTLKHISLTGGFPV
ncbi:LIM domain-containing protein HDR3 [Phragmites australis]|uniref:LIM domain-containing protein HDR3 n=1 Tax=Phragmites australis TaxID=29695 RepID=UPI002D79C444|nr:LIM domain-containing protein HDR3 [Phragmites australis]